MRYRMVWEQYLDGFMMQAISRTSNSLRRKFDRALEISNEKCHKAVEVNVKAKLGNKSQETESNFGNKSQETVPIAKRLESSDEEWLVVKLK